MQYKPISALLSARGGYLTAGSLQGAHAEVRNRTLTNPRDQPYLGGPLPF
jgi:hypothetical protein